MKYLKVFENNSDKIIEISELITQLTKYWEICQKDIQNTINKDININNFTFKYKYKCGTDEYDNRYDLKDSITTREFKRDNITKLTDIKVLFFEISISFKDISLSPIINKRFFKEKHKIIDMIEQFVNELHNKKYGVYYVKQNKFNDVSIGIIYTIDNIKEMMSNIFKSINK